MLIWILYIIFHIQIIIIQTNLNFTEGLTACVGKNSNIYFRKINRLECKAILIAYFTVAMYERPKE